MRNAADILRTAVKSPGYAIMRGLARSKYMRSAVQGVHRGLHRQAQRDYLARCSAAYAETAFPGVSADAMVAGLRNDGIAFGLKLPQDLVRDIREWSETATCYADRNPSLGFRLRDYDQACRSLDKKILVAQYMNAYDFSPAIRKLATDPLLCEVACKYLESVPTFVGANLWWTFPVDASAADRDRHAHLFHRDVDDYAFMKFFFYITNVEAGDGCHVCVKATHREKTAKGALKSWEIRRFSDHEIVRDFGADSVLEIAGSPGDGFAEDTLCIHKALTPVRNRRLLLQLQYALFDYGVTDDIRKNDELALIQS